jgi:hypothetical protein
VATVEADAREASLCLWTCLAKAAGLVRTSCTEFAEPDRSS